MLADHVVYSFITLLVRSAVCWFVLQSSAFCSAVGKVRNESCAEQPAVDTDQLDASLSICLSDTDAQVSPPEIGIHTQPRCVWYSTAVPWKETPVQSLCSSVFSTVSVVGLLYFVTPRS